jgi:hypothetical protein
MKLKSFIAGGDDVAEAIEYENSRRFERYNWYLEETFLKNFLSIK